MTRIHSPAARRRAFTLLELLVVMVVGGILATVAYNLMDHSTAAARRIEFRLALGAEIEPALERIQTQLDRMVPAGLPGVDYASEVFEPNLLRFNSSRSLGVQEGDALGSIELVEIRLESDAEVEAARKSGELDDRDGQRLLVSTIRPDVVLRDRNAGYAFRKVHQMALAFGYKRAEGVATGRPNEIVATLRAKSQVREWPLEMDLSASWTMPAGMEAAR